MEKNPPILICDCDHKDVDIEKAVLARAGLETKWLHCKTQEDVIEQCQGAVCLINQYVKLDAHVFEHLPSLKMIARYGVGVDNVNLADADKYGIQVCNVPDYGTNEVADQALALMMAVTRKVHMIANRTCKGDWDYAETIPVRRLSECTVGILGVGRIGSAFARRVQPLGCRVIGYDSQYGQEGRSFPDFVEFKKSADEVLAEADILSIHTSLDSSNKGMMDGEAFGKMKDGSYFINVARGGLVDEDALAHALETGKLAGAGIDVVNQEPLPAQSPLFRFENAVITPHMAWYSEEAARELKRKVAEEALRFYQGEAVHYPVNHPKA